MELCPLWSLINLRNLVRLVYNPVITVVCWSVTSVALATQLQCATRKDTAPPTTTTHEQKTLVNLPVIRMTFGQHAFAYVGVYLWRFLPTSLWESGFQEEFSRAAYYYIDSHNDTWMFNCTCYVYILNFLLLLVFVCILSCTVLFQDAFNSSHWLKASPV